MQPGVSTWDLDQIARRELDKRKVKAAFLGYHGFPATVCASINEEIVHGIPNKESVLEEGDSIGLDFGVVCKGYVGDSARTIPCGTRAPGITLPGPSVPIIGSTKRARFTSPATRNSGGAS